MIKRGKAKIRIHLATLSRGRKRRRGVVICTIEGQQGTGDARRPLPDRARSAVFSSIPDAVLVSGQITGEAAAMSDLEAVKAVLPDTPVLANTGVHHETIADVIARLRAGNPGAGPGFSGCSTAR